jgi:hypothetical protein
VQCYLIEDHSKQLKNSREALANEVEGCDVVRVKTEPENFEEEELKKDMNDVSVEVDDFKDANEALENQVKVCNDDKVRTEPDNFEDEDMKALEDQDKG